MQLSKSLIKKRHKKRNTKVRSAFDDEDSDIEEKPTQVGKSHIENMLSTQTDTNLSMAEARKSNKYLKEAMEEDPSIFDYDAQRSTIQEINRIKSDLEKAKKVQPEGSKYIQSMMKSSALRREDRESRQQNALKRRAEDAHLSQKVVLMSESYSKELSDASRTGALSKEEIFQKISERDDSISHERPEVEDSAEGAPIKKRKQVETSIDLEAARLRAIERINERRRKKGFMV